MEYLLFIVFLLLFAWLVSHIRFFTSTGLSKAQLRILFLLKVIAGIFYGWMGVYYAGTAMMLDTWAYHQEGVKEYHLLWSDPIEYLTNLFHNPYPGGFMNFFASSDSYWNDLKSNIFIKLLSVFDIFSFGHYYVNVIFYCFLAFIGPVAIYKVMIDVFPGRKTVLLPAVFFIPSFFYWSSGIHKEGLLFSGMGLIIYQLYFTLKERRLTWGRIGGIIAGLLILLFLRNFILVLMVPAIMAWLLASRWPHRALICFLSVYLFFGLLFFNLRYINPQFDLPQAVVEKQQAFLQLVGGNSSIPINQLKPTAISFVLNMPQAITLSTFRPYPTDIKHFFSLAAAVELGLYLLLFLLFLMKRRRYDRTASPLILFCLFFALTLLLAVGFSVNNLGAIVRYRSIIIPFLLVPMLAMIDWQGIYRLFRVNGNKT